MRISPTRIYDPPDLIPLTWVINYWLIDANTPVLLPMITSNVVVLKPTIVTTNLETNAAIYRSGKCIFVNIKCFGNYKSL